MHQRSTTERKILCSFVIRLLLLLVAGGTAGVSAFSLPPPVARQHLNTMGIAASLGQYLFGPPSPPQEKSTLAATATTNPTTKKTRRTKKKGDQKVSKQELKQHAVQRQRKIEAFCQQVLDPTVYIEWPVRESTMQAAALYARRDDDDTTTIPTLLPGTHKHLGGAVDPTTGTIFGVPANSKAVLVLEPIDMNDDGIPSEYRMTHIPLPKGPIADTKMKWLRGFVTQDGFLWAIPSWGQAVLCVNLQALSVGSKKQSQQGQSVVSSNHNDHIVQYIPLPAQHPKGMIWQWHGAGLNVNQTAAYAIPSNAHTVLKIDLITKTTSLIEITYDATKYPDFDVAQTNKWYGGITGDDNAVYGVCYRACAVLRIDCTRDTATLIGPDYGTGKFNWHGGIKVHGKIYAHPSHSPDSVLVIDTTPCRTNDDRCYELPIQRAPYDTDPRKNFKWLGGAVGADGSTIFCPACDCSSILKIDTQTDTCTTFGFAGTEKNKWQGGILGRDGCIYNIPASGRHILRIATFGDEYAVQLLGDLPPHADKWQGAGEGLDGSLYFIPENAYRVLKVTPPESSPPIVNGKLPEDDVKIEFL